MIYTKYTRWKIHLCKIFHPFFIVWWFNIKDTSIEFWSVYLVFSIWEERARMWLHFIGREWLPFDVDSFFTLILVCWVAYYRHPHATKRQDLIKWQMLAIWYKCLEWRKVSWTKNKKRENWRKKTQTTFWEKSCIYLFDEQLG